MQTANGRSSLVTGLGTIELIGPLTVARFSFLVFLGMLLIGLHQTFHYPLKMPGHHGLEGMALMVIGRFCCTDRWAATIVGMSAAATAGITGIEHDLWSAGMNIVPGLFLDAGLMLFPAWRSALFIVPVVTAFAHAMKPMVRWGIAESMGVHFGSLKNGLLYPLSTHLAYGFAGALIATLMWRATMKQASER